MDFTFNEEQITFQETARKFAQKKLAPIAGKMDVEKKFDPSILKEMADLGYFGMMVSEEYGGAGMDVLSYVLSLIEISKACASTSTILSVHNSLICEVLLKIASKDQREKYLPAVASGKKIGAFSITEANAGSDAAGIRCKAKLEGDHYIIDGTKIFVTNAEFAELFLVFVRTGPGERDKGISALIVDRDSPGFKTGKVERKMGLRASSTCELIFEGCKVPVSNRVLEEGEGFNVAMGLLEGGRIGIAAQAVGIAEAAFEEALKYAQQREQFGKPLARHQAIGFMLADMKMGIDAAKLLIYKAALMKDQGKKCRLEAAMAKLYASEIANRVTADAVQIHGGYGYIEDFPVERYYRDARITTIYEGTSQVQKMIILKELLGK